MNMYNSKWLSKIGITLFFILTIIVCSYFYFEKGSITNQLDYFDYARDQNRFIAHAGGRIDGKNYTNSLEALNLNYERGFRLFELDIIQTSDGHYVAAHDWDKWAKITGYTGEIPPDKSTFLKTKIYNKYTPMDMNIINDWFSVHSDAILISDKVNNPKHFSKQFIDKNRLMMELFTWQAVKQAINSKIKSAMPTGNLLLKIKGDKIKYLNKLGITEVVMSRNFLRKEINLIKKLNTSGIRIYAFHINEKKGKGTHYMICNESKYFYGIYANIWNKDFSPKCENKKT